MTAKGRWIGSTLPSGSTTGCSMASKNWETMVKEDLTSHEIHKFFVFMNFRWNGDWNDGTSDSE